MGTVEFTPEALAAAAQDRPLPEHWSAREEGARVAARYGLTYEEMIGPSRVLPCPQARAEFYRLLRGRGWSYPRIGKHCGGRDHTTIMVALGDAERRAKKAAAKKLSYQSKRVA